MLIETGLNKLVDKLIVVKSKRGVQIARLLKKTPLNKQDILKRIRFQVALRDKVRLADFLIDNSGSIRQTRKQVQKIRRKLWKN